MVSVPEFVRQHDEVNIFVTDENPNVACLHLDDKRLGKMLMESCQLLSIAVHHHRPDISKEHVGPGKLCQGGSWHNTPVAQWVMANKDNWLWLFYYAEGLGEEWVHRFGTDHGARDRVPYIAEFSGCLPLGQMLPFHNGARHQGLGIDFTYLPVPKSYRHYLNARWSKDTNPVRFTNREKPEWAR